MLDISSYKNVMDACNQLTNWLEQAQQSADLPKAPPDDLVAEFRAALEGVPQDGGNIPSSPVADVHTMDDVRVNKDLSVVTNRETINIDDGMEVLDATKTHTNNDMPPTKMVEHLLEILSKKAQDMTPIDLLQAQRYVGMLSYVSESGKKTSEGVSEVIETALDMEG